ncbi:uncharacterized membrane protein YoaK (UPF0700 family) [Sphingomonas sp. UYP23]
MSKKPSSTDPLVWLLLLLSVTTGLVDATSVLGLGKVFTANMTGNVVFLGFAVTGTPGFRIWPSVAAMAAFMAGALVAGRIFRSHSEGSFRRWLVTAAVIEGGLLWLAAAVAIGLDVASQSPGWRVYTIIALTAIAMGFRNATIRQLKVPDLTTTVLTMTFTGIAADSKLAGGANVNWARRLWKRRCDLRRRCAGGRAHFPWRTDISARDRWGTRDLRHIVLRSSPGVLGAGYEPIISDVDP